jgi:cytoskeletal protein RodZ
MSEEMRKLGQVFAERRVEKKLSLKEVESATSIRASYLDAIEQGQMEKLISPVYAQGFVRQYATFLGIDGDKLISENSEVFRKPIQQEFAYGIGTLETRTPPGGGVKSASLYFWLVGIGLLCIASYLLVKVLDLL